jgi:hypothetical protein
VTDTQGEVVHPVHVGRAPASPATRKAATRIDDDLEFEAGDFMLVKRGDQQLPVSPPVKKARFGPGDRKRTETSGSRCAEPETERVRRYASQSDDDK